MLDWWDAIAHQGYRKVIRKLGHKKRVGWAPYQACSEWGEHLSIASSSSKMQLVPFLHCPIASQCYNSA